MTPEELAQRFHETYERLAPEFGYKTREASAKPWAEVPPQNKALMIAVCAQILPSTPVAAQGQETTKCSSCGESKPVHVVAVFHNHNQLPYCEDCWVEMFCSTITPQIVQDAHGMGTLSAGVAASESTSKDKS